VTGLVDARGCLTDAGFAALASARPGGAPAELAAHLGGCARCQDRVLQAAAGVEGAGAGRLRKPARSERRRWLALALVMGVLLIAIVGLLATLAYVRG
jgi:hypothetical protein